MFKAGDKIKYVNRLSGSIPGLEPLPARILKHLRARKSISPMEALASYGTTRLAAAIFKLRRAGFDITTQINHDQAGHGYARYTLAAVN
jgi:hypothetical protein